MKNKIKNIRKACKLKKEYIQFLRKHFPKQNKQTLSLLKIKNNLTSRYCPICSSKESRLFLKAPVYDFVKCKECNMVYANKVLKQEIALKLYKKSILDCCWGETYKLHQQIGHNSKVERKLKDILKHTTTQDSLLDIGCNQGIFLNKAKHYFKKCEGIEVNKKTAKIAMNNGLKIHTKPIESLKIRKSYDVIVIDQLLEHIYDLNNFILHVKKILKKDGVLFISTPNLDSLGFRLFKEHHMQVYSWFHINLFTLDTLKKLLTKYGLKIKKLGTDNVLDIATLDILFFSFRKQSFIHRINYCGFYEPFYFADRLIQKLINTIKPLSLAKNGAFLEVVAIK